MQAGAVFKGRRVTTRAVAVVVAINVVGVVAGLGLSLARADHPGGPTTTENEQPVRHAGNQNCAELFPGTIELRIQSPASAPFTADGRTVTLSTYATPSGEAFDFTASHFVLGVAVKGGDNTNSYDYQPNGVRKDTSLHAPVNHANGKFYGLSHISICFAPDPELSVTKTADDSSVSSTESIGFGITVANTGGSTALATTLNDPLPAADGVEWSIDTQPAQGSCSISGSPPSQVLSCSFGDLLKGASVSVHVTSATTSATSGVLPNTATAQADNADPAKGTDSITVNPPVLEVTKTAASSSVSSGQSIGFGITVANTGAGVAFNAGLSDDLPAAQGVDWTISTQPAQGSCTITGTPPTEQLTCSFGDLAAAASVSVGIVSDTTAQTVGTLDNTATGKADNAPDDDDDDSITVKQPSLSVTKTADDSSVSSTESIGFTIAVSNSGAGVALGAGLTDPLPAAEGVDWAIDTQPAQGSCSIAGAPPAEELSCTFGDLASGGSVSVHITSATTEATTGLLDNTATAHADNAPNTTDKDSITVKQPNLAVTKTADDSSVSSTESIGFTIAVSNAGPGVAFSTTLADTLPAANGVDWAIDTQPAQGSCAITGTPPSETLSCSFGDLAPGASVSIHITSATTESTSGTLTNKATADATNAPEVDDTDTITVSPPALSITKTAADSLVEGGDPIAFTISVTNSGAGTAFSVTISDPLPGASGVDWEIDPAYTGPGTCAVVGGPPTEALSCSLGHLAPGEGATVRLASATTLATCGDLTNQAVADASNHAEVTSAASTITVSPPGALAAAGGRAYGLSASLLAGTIDLGPEPDTDSLNPDEALSLGVPATDPVASVGLLRVSNDPETTSTGTNDSALASASEVAIDVPDIVEVSASTIVARSYSEATGSSASSTSAGSVVQNLVINGITYGDVTSPLTVEVANPLGQVIATVSVLETDGSGAAGGAAQPDADRRFSSGLAVNGLHVVVADNPLTPLNDASDIIVSHAESSAAFASGLACDAQLPQVFGDAYIVGVDEVQPPLGGLRLGLVELPVTGGDEQASVADLSPLGTGTGSAATEGTLTPAAASRATAEALELLGGAITAQLVEATSSTDDDEATGSTVIADLEIGGTDVCAALGLEDTCRPAPNTVLVIDDGTMIVLLNEQLTGNDLRVNAVHIFVVGAANPLGLPAGAELILSSAFSGTSR